MVQLKQCAVVLATSLVCSTSAGENPSQSANEQVVDNRLRSLYVDEDDAEPTYTDDNYDDYYNDNDGADVDRYDDGGGSVFDIDDDKWSRSYDDEWDRCYTPKRDDDNWLRVPKSGKTKGGKTKGGYYSSKGGKTKGSKYYGDYGWLDDKTSTNTWSPDYDDWAGDPKWEPDYDDWKQVPKWEPSNDDWSPSGYVNDLDPWETPYWPGVKSGKTKGSSKGSKTKGDPFAQSKGSKTRGDPFAQPIGYYDDWVPDYWRPASQSKGGKTRLFSPVSYSKGGKTKGRALRENLRQDAGDWHDDLPVPANNGDDGWHDDGWHDDRMVLTATAATAPSRESRGRPREAIITKTTLFIPRAARPRDACSRKAASSDATVTVYDSLIGCCHNDFGSLDFRECKSFSEDVCIPNIETPEPTLFPTTEMPTDEIETPEPTQFPTTEMPTTASPTTCEQRKWYSRGGFNQAKTCTNGYDSNEGDNFYHSLTACCRREFPNVSPKFCKSFAEDVCIEPLITPNPTTPSPTTPSPTTPYPTPDPTPDPTPKPTRQPTPSPTTCEEREWYYTSNNICTNFGNPPTSSYPSKRKCCMANTETDTYEEIQVGALGGTYFPKPSTCVYYDFCIPFIPPSPPTGAPTFGSTPTVSKETTGPPTLAIVRHHEEISEGGSNDLAFQTVHQHTTTECVEKHSQAWSPGQQSMVKVCVYVCSSTTTVTDGGGNIIRVDENEHTIDCPEQEE
ncbi:hypothetical protein THAOC_01562 [Thalassiosira oceanica]|uniref:Uncharacterized protein n=1 Tax=Thalassiosira oceanica TaxID=159749 RepID=K0TQU7_THAOC|nr:hypothetical protein THAOC_01562 [Thalassiosira oceanica]|eukprot:EJK76667.1 hypothetical protein THAOC_01562 [Thalassiosira oceanica]